MRAVGDCGDTVTGVDVGVGFVMAEVVCYILHGSWFVGCLFVVVDTKLLVEKSQQQEVSC